MPTYEFIIKNESNGQKKLKSPTANSSSESAKEKQTTLISGVAAYAYAKKITTQVISYRVNTVELRTGQAELQEKISFKYDIAQRTFGFIESIAIGGGLAGIPGAVIGGMAALTTWAINVAQKQSTINLNRDIENIAILQNNIRAGARGSRGDLR